MLITTYKTTLKSILRSPLFYIAFVIILLIIMETPLGACRSETLIGEDGMPFEILLDTDPRFWERMTWDDYIITIQNSQSAFLMSYAIPLFSVLTVIIALAGDYKNNFFEIERSAGVKVSSYFFGRLCAITTVNFSCCLIGGLVSFHSYFLSRQIPSFMTALEYFADSTVRILRVFVCAEVITVLFFTCLTFMVAALTKSTMVGGIIGMSSVLFMYVSGSSLKSNLPKIYHDYMKPHSLDHYAYWGFYDTEIFSNKYVNPFTSTDVLICTAYLLGIALLFAVITYVSTRRREI